MHSSMMRLYSTWLYCGCLLSADNTPVAAPTPVTAAMSAPKAIPVNASIVAPVAALSNVLFLLSVSLDH